MLKPFRYAFALLVLAWVQTPVSEAAPQAYMVVTTSTAAPQGFAASVIQALTSQFTATVTPNPFAANTYSIVLFSPNPGYQQPVSDQDLLNALVAVSSNDYVYGFANGQNYDQRVQDNLVESFEVNCSTPMVGVANWDQSTCEAVTEAIDGAIFEESLSTPTVIPLGGQ